MQMQSQKIHSCPCTKVHAELQTLEYHVKTLGAWTACRVVVSECVFREHRSRQSMIWKDRDFKSLSPRNISVPPRHQELSLLKRLRHKGVKPYAAMPQLRRSKLCNSAPASKESMRGIHTRTVKSSIQTLHVYINTHMYVHIHIYGDLEYTP